MAATLAQLDQRRHALAINAARYDELRRVHKALAHQLEDPHSPNAQALLERARRQIDTWESGHTCSPIYVKAWRRALRDPAPRILHLVEGNKGIEDAMLQNSPFGFALHDPRFAKESG